MPDAARPPTTTVVAMGVSGSGKSTIAEGIAGRMGWDFVEGDALHPPANVAKMRAGTPLTDDDRWPWLREVAAVIGEHEAAGTSLVITCSALRHAYRDLLRDGHPSVWFAHVHASEETLAGRVGNRPGHFMPPSLLRSQLDTLEMLTPDEPGELYDSEGSAEDSVRALLSALERERGVTAPD